MTTYHVEHGLERVQELIEKLEAASLHDDIAAARSDGLVGRGVPGPPERLGDYAVDGIAPQAAVFPAKSEDVSEVLSFATGEGKRVTPWGGGTQIVPRKRAHGVGPGTGLETPGPAPFPRAGGPGGKCWIGRYDPGVAPRVRFARRGQFLPLEVPLPALATVGGALAANSSGPSRLAYGTARDWLIGIVVAQADGTITKSGGRVVKNVTGYDLNKLYIGSLGTLGVILEATFKVAPMPEDKRTLIGAYSSLNVRPCRRRRSSSGAVPRAPGAAGRRPPGPAAVARASGFSAERKLPSWRFSRAVG